MISGYKISSETNDMDVSVIHGYISRSYWAENIPLRTMETAINNSLCFGVFTDSGNQVAFARMITNSATFAYLADVFVLEEHRGKGISKWIMKNIIDHPNLQGIRRMNNWGQIKIKLYFHLTPILRTNFFVANRRA